MTCSWGLARHPCHSHWAPLRPRAVAGGPFVLVVWLFTAWSTKSRAEFSTRQRRTSSAKPQGASRTRTRPLERTHAARLPSQISRHMVTWFRPCLRLDFDQSPSQDAAYPECFSVRATGSISLLDECQSHRHTPPDLLRRSTNVQNAPDAYKQAAK
jgi:hypothetical protein